MRTTTVKLGNREYTLCFSVRVAKACSERYGAITNIGDVLSSGSEAEVLDETIWLLTTMMDAGYRYAKNNGIETAVPMSADDILDNFDMADYKSLVREVKKAIGVGTTTNVETVNEGNAEATRE